MKEYLSGTTENKAINLAYWTPSFVKSDVYHLVEGQDEVSDRRALLFMKACQR